MASTTNYSWSTPDDTALVKDGAAAIRSLGSSIDTTTKALNPSTTLGDIEYRSATANTNTRLAIGTSGQVLTVNGSGVPAWSTISAGGMTEIASGSLSGSSLVMSSIPGTYKHLQLSLRGVSANANANMLLTFNSIASGYTFTGTRGTTSAAAFGSFADSQINLQGGGTSNMGSAYTDNSYFIEIYDYASTNTKKGRITEFWNSSADAEWFADRGFVSGDSSAAITSITITLSAGSYDAGTYVLWGLS